MRSIRIKISRRLSFACALFTTVALFAADPPEGAGKRLLETSCVSCHSLDILTEKRWSEAKWNELVDAMVARGAALDQKESKQVAAYLAENFGVKERSRTQDLVEGICTLCHELDRVKVQELTREEWASEIKGMISEGAPVTEEEFELIVSYLAANYGPPLP